MAKLEHFGFLTSTQLTRDSFRFFNYVGYFEIISSFDGMKSQWKVFSTKFHKQLSTYSNVFADQIFDSLGASGYNFKV